MWERRLQVRSAVGIAAVVVTFLLFFTPLVLADAPTQSTDNIVGTSQTPGPVTPVNACVAIGTTAISGVVTGGIFNGATFTATGSIKVNQCTNLGSFTGMLLVSMGIGNTITFSMSGTGTGTPPILNGNFHAFNGTGAFPKCGHGTVTGLATGNVLTFSGNYHFTHNC